MAALAKQNTILHPVRMNFLPAPVANIRAAQPVLLKVCDRRAVKIEHIVEVIKFPISQVVVVLDLRSTLLAGTSMLKS